MAGAPFGDDRLMSVDGKWLRSVSDAIGAVDDGDLGLVPVDHEGEPPQGMPDYFLERPHFAVHSCGVPVGRFETLIVVAGSTPKLAIRKLIIRQDAQGLGIARAIQGHLERRLPALGIDRITLDASGGGSYAWARLGYDFDIDAYRGMRRFAKIPTDAWPRQIRSELLIVPAPPEWKIPSEYGGGTVPPSAPDSAAQMLRDLKRVGKRQEKLVADLKHLILGEAGSVPPSANEIALFGRGVREDAIPVGSWVGRELMIRSNWSGIRKLTGGPGVS